MAHTVDGDGRLHRHQVRVQARRARPPHAGFDPIRAHHQRADVEVELVAEPQLDAQLRQRSRVDVRSGAAGAGDPHGEQLDVDRDADGLPGADRDRGQRQLAAEMHPQSVGVVRRPGHEIGGADRVGEEREAPGHEHRAVAGDGGAEPGPDLEDTPELLRERAPTPGLKNLHVVPADRRDRVGEELGDRHLEWPRRRGRARGPAESAEREQGLRRGRVAERGEEVADRGIEHGAAGVEDGVGVGEVESCHRRHPGERHPVCFQHVGEPGAPGGQPGAQRADVHRPRSGERGADEGGGSRDGADGDQGREVRGERGRRIGVEPEAHEVGDDVAARERRPLPARSRRSRATGRARGRRCRWCMRVVSTPPLRPRSHRTRTDRPRCPRRCARRPQGARDDRPTRRGRAPRS